MRSHYLGNDSTNMFLTDTQADIVITTLFFMALITFVANLTVLVTTITGKMYRYHVYKFLLSLQVGDMLNSLTMCGAFYNAVQLKKYKDIHLHMPYGLCELIGLVGNICSFNSVWTVCFILLDRMYVLADPFGYRLSSAKDFLIVVSISWTVSFVFCCIPLLGVGKYEYLYTFLMCQVSLGSVPTKSSIAWHIILVCCAFLVPVCCILLCYCILRPLLTWKQRRYIGPSIKCKLSMFDLVVLVHMLCTWPLYIALILDQVYVTVLHKPHVIPNMFWLICDLLFLGNSTVNPFIYGLANRQIRQVIISKLDPRARSVVTASTGLTSAPASY